MMKKPETSRMYGLVAEFASSDDLLKAAEQVRDAGYTMTDAFSPIPVHGLTDALGVRPSRLASLVLIGGLTGACAGLGLQFWVSSVAYPHIIAGKPFFSWPSFFPVVFECTVLFAAASAVFGMLMRNRLPQPYHPVFSTPHFEKATTDGYFLCIQANDPQYDSQQTTTFLKGLNPVEVTEVERHPDDEDKS